jgi:hypothetical protein
MKKPRERGASLESVEARDQGRPRTGVVGVVGGSGVVSVGKRFVQKNGLTWAQSQESVLSDLNVSTRRAAVALLVTAPARSIRLILTFPSAPAAIETSAERSEKRRPATMAVMVVLDFIAVLPSFPCAASP